MAHTENGAGREELEYIDFEWNGNTYTLEFNSKTAEYVERGLGINVVEILSTGRINITDMPKLFQAALMMHHPNMKQNVSMGMYEMMTDKEELGLALIELLAAAVNSVLEEPEEGKGIGWTRH